MQCSVPMGDDVLFVGHYAHRKPGSFKRLLICFAFGGLLSTFALACLRPSFPNRVWVPTIVVVVGAMCAAIGLLKLWPWILNRVDRLEITGRGITYGAEHWNWDRVAAIRIRLLPRAAGFWAIQLRIRDDRTGTYYVHPCLIDGHITWQERERLVFRIKLFLKNSDTNTICEE